MNSPNRKMFAITALVLCLVGGGAYALGRHQATSSQIPLSESQEGYFVEGDTVYYRDVDAEVRGADAPTFVSLDEYWGKDKTNLFYLGKILNPTEGTPPADMASLTPLNLELARDSRAVYEISYNSTNDSYGYKVVPEADPVTFEVLEDAYARDKAHAYYVGTDGVRKIEGADGSTFTVLSRCAAAEKSVAYYAADAKSVIAGDTILPEIDRDTFYTVAEIINPDGMFVLSTYSVDKNRVYKGCGEVTQGNPQTCSFSNLKECE